MAKVTNTRRNSSRPKGRYRKSKNKSNRFVRLFVSTVLALAFVTIGYYLLNRFYPDYHNFDDNKLNEKFEVRGIDLSHHNEEVNWQAIRDENVSFAYLKVTEGTTLRDRQYERNYRIAKSNNIRVGTYHFFSFSSSGEEQAKHFIREAICQKGDLVPAIDMEHSTGNKYSAKKANRDKVVEELKVFEKKLRNFYGRYPIIYTNKECYELYIQDHFPKNPIWICDLGKTPNEGIANWVIWQFSHKGQISGTPGHVDLNYYRYSFDKFKELIL